MPPRTPDPKLKSAYDTLLSRRATDANLQLWLSIAAIAVIVFECSITGGRYALAPFWLLADALCMASLSQAIYRIMLLQRQRKTGIQTEVVWVEKVHLVRDRPWGEGPTVRLWVRVEPGSSFMLRATSRCPLSGVTREDLGNSRLDLNPADGPTTAKQKAWVVLSGRKVRIVCAKHLGTALSVELLSDTAGS